MADLEQPHGGNHAVVIIIRRGNRVTEFSQTAGHRIHAVAAAAALEQGVVRRAADRHIHSIREGVARAIIHGQREARTLSIGMRQGEADNAAAVRNERLLIIVSFEVNGYARSRLGDDGQAVVVNLIDIQCGLGCRARDDKRALHGHAAGFVADVFRADGGIRARRAFELHGRTRRSRPLVTIALLPPSGTVEIAITGSFGLAVPLTVSLFSPGVTPADGDVYILLGHVQVFNHRRGYARLRRARNRRRRYTCPPRDFQS